MLREAFIVSQMWFVGACLAQNSTIAVICICAGAGIFGLGTLVSMMERD